ncbi:hypothetical protein ZIOFF_035877 [Zingiber officinale]|uniref:non-specific serine/threonine protein kinase n=1 Tax=Zingiber officinale TaxID=94328 RepID=A0A8J5L878_ZINOF|nr:hypothetical protein ZIOFF_035877 [Zingiber officinale]
MGNCLNSSSRVENAHPPQNASSESSSFEFFRFELGSRRHLSGSSKAAVTSKRSLFSVSSIRTTCSTPSTLSVQSSSDMLGSLTTPTPRTEGEILSSSQLKAFTFIDLKNATRNFRPESLLGEGGFGYVYKGWIDEQTFSASKPGCGMAVAVKKLKPESFQGHKEWLTEVDYLGQLHHPNLVKLIGYCSEGDNKLLVYEFMPKGSLENHLFRRGSQPLSWETRIKVAIGAARGLTFLHDAESQEFNAKLSDFGLAKAGPTGDKTHVSTQVIGTHGYAAPEYIATGRLSVKADVYSFGVVLLELLSGRRAVDKSKMGIEQNLVEWVIPFLGDRRKLYRIMDRSLEGQYPKKGTLAVSILALQCISDDPKLRPKMSDVLASLEQLQGVSSAARKSV